MARGRAVVRVRRRASWSWALGISLGGFGNLFWALMCAGWVWEGGEGGGMRELGCEVEWSEVK